MSSKNRIVFVVVFLLGVIAVSSVQSPISVQAQGPAIEVACPTGATPIPQMVLINPASGKIRQLACMDSNANLLLPMTNAGTAVWNASTGVLSLGNSSVGGQLLIAGAGGNATIGFNSGLSINAQLLFLTTTFASIGSVPAAGNAKFCTDCTTAATCAGSGTGHLAVSNGTNWTCQ